MNEQQTINKGIAEISFMRLFDAVMKKLWLVILMSILGAVLTFAITFFLITPKYESAAMFYVNNNALSVGDTSFSISSGDLTTSRNLVESYIVILNTRESLNDVIDYSNVDRTYKEIKDMISAAAVNETEIFEVVVTSEDPVEAEKIASAIAYILPKRISTIIEGTSAKVVDAAVIPSKPSSPNYIINTFIGFLLGFMLSIAAIVVTEMFDITVRNEEDIKQSCKYPILAKVPDMMSAGKGGYYRYGTNDTQKKSAAPGGKKPDDGNLRFVGGNISFAAAEAYKLLRTKLQFSFTDDNECHIIGISSALSGEGKSLTSINLAYTLTQLDKKVLLIDCDMRRPTLAKKLGVRRRPGLSSFLTGQSDFEDIVQLFEVSKDESAFHVIVAGECPPNPVELLSSARMENVLTGLRKIYDYIILDLPPVGEVSDAMSVAKNIDGMLLVARQNLCNRLVLNEAVRQFEFVDTKILGVVFNCTSEHIGGYSNGYYKKYYKSYT